MCVSYAQFLRERIRYLTKEYNIPATLQDPAGSRPAPISVLYWYLFNRTLWLLDECLYVDRTKERKKAVHPQKIQHTPLFNPIPNPPHHDTFLAVPGTPNPGLQISNPLEHVHSRSATNDDTTSQTIDPLLQATPAHPSQVSQTL